MKICKRILSLVLALVLLLSPVLSAPVFAASETTQQAENTLYIFDLGAFLDTLPGTRVQYDYLKFATALQGLANRDGAHIYYEFWQAYDNEKAGIEIEDIWLDYLTEVESGNGTLNDGTDLADYEQVVVTDFWQLVETFAGVADGLVIWEEDVPSTANVASTIAGVENLLPVRYSTSPVELYSQLMSGDHGKWTIKRNLVGLFDGKTIPTFASSVPGKTRAVDTGVDSTGSIKTDPYIWAKVNYLDTGKTNPNLMTYSLDAGSYQYPKTLEETLGSDAEFLTTNLPAYLQAGSTVPVRLKVKNTGTTTWDGSKNFRLGMNEQSGNCPYRQVDIDAMTDAAQKAQAQKAYDEFWRNNTKLLNANGGVDSSWFNRVNLPSNVTVAPGEIYTFDVQLVVPEKLNGHELEFYMIQDGAAGEVSGKFGEQFRAPVMVVEEISEDASAFVYEGAGSTDYLCAEDEYLAAAIANCEAKGKDEAFVRSYLAYETEGTVTIHAQNTGAASWLASDNYVLDYGEGEIALETDVAPGEVAAFTVPIASGDTEAGDEATVTVCLRKDGKKISNACTAGVEVIASFGAEFVSYDAPELIVAGDKVVASLTWRNTGAFRWGDGSMNICIGSGSRHVSGVGAEDDASTHGYNHPKISSVDVSYGETYTFYVEVHAEPSPLADANGKDLSRVSNGKLTLPFSVQTANSTFQNIQFSPQQKITWTIGENEVETNYVYREGADVQNYPISIDSENIPSVMAPGEVVKLSITTTNTGDEAWYSHDHGSNDHVLNEETGELCPNSSTTASIRMLLACSVDKNGAGAFSLARDEAFTNWVGTEYVLGGLRDIAVDGSWEWVPYLRAPETPGVYTVSIGFDNPRDGTWYDETIEKVIFVGEQEYPPETVVKTDAEAPVTTDSYTAEITSYRTLTTVEPGQTFPIVVSMKNTGIGTLTSGKRGNNEDTMRLAFGGAVGARDSDKNYLPVTDGAMAERFFVLCGQSMTARASDDHPYGQNGGDYNRMDFGGNMRVGSGEYVTFSGELVAPTTPGTYTVTLQPVQDGIAFRGDQVELTVNVAESDETGGEGEIVHIAAPIEAAIYETFDAGVAVRNYGDSAWTAVADPTADDGFILQYTFGGQTGYASVATTEGKLSTFDLELKMPRKVGAQELTVQMFRREGGSLTAIGAASTVTVGVAHAEAEEIVFNKTAAMTGEDYTAEILSVTVPETVKPGSITPISVTVKNTGTQTLYPHVKKANALESLRIRVAGAAGYHSAENEANKNPDILDENYLMSNKFFVLTDGTETSRDDVTGVWFGAGNREYSRVDLLPNTTLASGDTITLNGWIVAPSTEGAYELTFDPIADLTAALLEEGHTAEKGSTYSVNIAVSESGAKIWEQDFYEAEGSAIYANTSTGLFNSALPNADYYIANKAFFWDLSQEADIAPKDDRDQPIGTDVKTLRALLLSQMQQAQKNKNADSEGLEGSGIFTVGGFVPWVLKYNSYADEMSGDTAVDAEWGMIDIISEYGGQTDADAFGTVGIVNTSVYQHVALSVSGSINPTQAKLDFNPEVGDASVQYDANTIYLMFYMGDYDGGSWVGNLLKPIWDDPERGTLPLAWAICGNLADRIPQVYNYLYDTAKPNDYFVTGDNGTGYLNPQWMLNPRDAKITTSDISENRDSWLHYNTEINEKFKLGITGFYISATRGGLDDNALEILHELTPYGVTDNAGKVTSKGREHYGIYTPTDAADGTVATPFTYTRSIGKLNTPELIDTQVSAINKQIGISGQFLSLRTVKALPSEINDLVDALQASQTKTVKVVDPYTYFRLYKEANEGNTVSTYPSITLVGSNISFGDQLSIVMSYNLNNMPASVTADYLKKNAGLLSWTNASDASACNTDAAEQSVGLTAVPAAMNAGQYAGETVGFTAKEASVYRYIRAYVDMPDGTRVYSAVKGYSPKLYANAMLDNADASDEMKTLAKALLNYAAAAQKYAGVTADANRELSTEDKKLVFSESDLVPAASVDLSKTTAPDFTKFWAPQKNIRMKDNFNLLFFWQMDAAALESASESGVLVWTEDAYNAATEISTATASAKYSLVSTTINGATHYGAEVVGIPARSIDQTVYACAYATIDGVTYYSDLINYSVHQYALKKLDDANMGELVKRVVNYGLAAKGYYESINA